MLPVADLVARLDDRFSLLTSGLRTADRRHASLRAAIDWSHEQLSARERMALRRLSVLVGGFGLEAATAICAAAEVRASAVFELLTALADKSLIAPVPGSGDTARFRMLESVRLYGREKLAAADEEALAFDRLVDWLAARSKVVLDTPSVPTAMFEWVLVEHDNLSHALDWLAGTADERQLLLGGALAHARFERGNVGSSRMLLDRALESTPPDARYRGRVLVEAGWLAAWQGDMETAIRLFEDGVARQRARGLLRMVSWHLRGLGHVHTENGDRAAAIATLEEAVRVARQCGAHGNAAAALQNLAWDAVVHGEPDRAAKLMDEALPVILSSEPRRSQSAALHTAGTIAWMRGGFREAQEHFLAILHFDSPKRIRRCARPSGTRATPRPTRRAPGEHGANRGVRPLGRLGRAGCDAARGISAERTRVRGGPACRGWTDERPDRRPPGRVRAYRRGARTQRPGQAARPVAYADRGLDGPARGRPSGVTGTVAPFRHAAAFADARGPALGHNHPREAWNINLYVDYPGWRRGHPRRWRCGRLPRDSSGASGSCGPSRRRSRKPSRASAARSRSGAASGAVRPRCWMPRGTWHRSAGSRCWPPEAAFSTGRGRSGWRGGCSTGYRPGPPSTPRHWFWSMTCTGRTSRPCAGSPPGRSVSRRNRYCCW